MFDSRSASLGHTLQGGIPSPLDRARGVRLAMKCMNFLEEHSARIKAVGPKEKDKLRKTLKGTAAVIAVQGSSVVFAPAQDVLEHADTKNRRGENPWWLHLKDLAETLGGK